MNGTGNEKCSLLPVVARFGFGGVFPFAVRCFLLCSSLLVLVFEIESVLSQNQNRQMPLAALFGFLLLVFVFCRCFHLGIALLLLVFAGMKNQNDQRKANEKQALHNILFSEWPTERKIFEEIVLLVVNNTFSGSKD